MQAESKQYKLAMNMFLWQMKKAFNEVSAGVFRDNVKSSLEAKKKQIEDQRVAEAVAKAKAEHRRGWFIYHCI